MARARKASPDGAGEVRRLAGGGRRKGAFALGAGAGALLGAGLVLQHRMASRATADDADFAADCLVLPDGLLSRYVPTDDGGMLHVVARGSGPAVVLLHGVTLTSATWVHQLRELSTELQVVALDQRGHGKSVPGSDGFRPPSGAASGGPGAPAMKRLAADVVSVLDALELDRVVLVGHSMGGMVTLQLLSDASPALRRRIAGVVLVATSAGPLIGLPAFAQVLGASTSAVRGALLSLERRGKPLMAHPDLAYWSTRLAFGAEAPPAQVRYAEAMINAMSPHYMADLIGDVAGFDISPALGAIDVPATVVVGTHDRLTPPWHARRMVRGLPDATLLELARCGHMVMLERPGELNRVIGEMATKVLV